MGSIASPRFYVYVLARPDGKPFYVGKGSGRRINEHERQARNGNCRCKKCNTIRKIWRMGGEVQRYIVFTTNDEPEALAHEAELIALYGRHTLCNILDGGDGPGSYQKGRKQTAESIAKRVAARRANGTYAHSAATREKLRLNNKASTPEVRAKMSAAAQLHAADPAIRAKHRAAASKRMADPAIRAKIANARRGYRASPETRAKQSAALRIAWERRKRQQEEGS